MQRLEIDDGSREQELVELPGRARHREQSGDQDQGCAKELFRTHSPLPHAQERQRVGHREESDHTGRFGLFFFEVHFLNAAMVLHRRYHGLPFRPRLHLLIRFLTCPFHRVLRFLPPRGRLLEVGGGHGLFATLAADRGLRACVVEPDIRKLFAAGRSEKIRFVGGFDESVRGEFDVVAILDVLYAIPIDEWDALLDRLRAQLADGGTLLIKEMDPRSWKQQWNRLQEWISMRVLHITYAKTFNYEPPQDFVRRLRRHGFASVEIVRIDAGYPHPHLLFVARV